MEILPDALSIDTTSPEETFSRSSDSIIFVPRSYTVSISVVFSVSFPVLAAPPAAGRSISISTTSPSIISVSSLMRTPMALRKACDAGRGGEGSGSARVQRGGWGSVRGGERGTRLREGLRL